FELFCDAVDGFVGEFLSRQAAFPFKESREFRTRFFVPFAGLLAIGVQEIEKPLKGGFIQIPVAQRHTTAISIHPAERSPPNSTGTATAPAAPPPTAPHEALPTRAIFVARASLHKSAASTRRWPDRLPSIDLRPPAAHPRA